MKIAFFQPYVANWRVQFLEYFIRHTCHDVVIYDGGFGKKNDTKSVVTHNASFARTRMLSCSPILRVHGQEYPLYWSPFLLYHLIKDMPDVVVTEGEINTANNVSIWFYCRMFRKRYVWWSLGKVRTRKKTVVNRLCDPLVDCLLKSASCVMARNTLARRYYVETKQVEPTRVIVAPNSMDDERAMREVDASEMERLTQLKRGPVILYVGALVKAKRPDDLLYAFAEVRTRNPGLKNTEVWFVGDGPERDMLSRLAADVGISDGVKFFGKVFDGVGNYFQVADVVVVPGLGGLVINHAMIFGKPVISRMADGTELDLVVDGQTGFLLHDYDNTRLAQAIETLLLSGELDTMSKNAQRMVRERWNIRIMTERVHECVEFVWKG